MSGLVDFVRRQRDPGAALLGSLLLFSGLSLHLQTNGASSGGGKHTALFVIAIACVVVMAALLVSGRLRRLRAGAAAAWWPDAKAAAAALRDRQKLAQLVGGNIATELLFASGAALSSTRSAATSRWSRRCS